MQPNQERDFAEFAESMLSVADKILDPEAIDVDMGSRVLNWLHKIELLKPLSTMCLRSEIDDQLRTTVDSEWDEGVRMMLFAQLVQTLDLFLEETKRSEHNDTELRVLAHDLSAIAEGFKSYKAKVTQ